ncbi:hypothetical protein BH11PSE11_BH11PSE11_35870 [soil metagenome]
MKRWPAIVSFLLFSALCASIAYWAMQFFKPVARQVAPQAQAPKTEYSMDAAARLFGGQKATAVAVASNYALKGVVVSRNPRDSIAILETDGKPAQAIRLGSDVMRGVKVEEVHAQYVLLSEGGVQKRVQLPQNATPQVNSGVAIQNRYPPPVQAQNPGGQPPPVTPFGVPGNVPQHQQVIVPPADPSLPNFKTNGMASPVIEPPQKVQ